jgi:condensin complex subunit 3
LPRSFELITDARGVIRARLHVSAMAEALIEIFEEAQRTEKSHKGCLRRLISVVKADKDGSAMNYLLRGVVDKVLLFPKNNDDITRMIAFLSAFIASLEESVMSQVLDHVCSRFLSSNKIVRQRACQMLAGTLEEIAEKGSEISCDLLESLAELVVPRLSDKIPAVRVWAVKAIKRLQNDEDSNDKAISELIRLMNCDSSVLVRMAAVECTMVCNQTVNALLARLKDIKTEVRVATLNRVRFPA